MLLGLSVGGESFWWGGSSSAARYLLATRQCGPGPLGLPFATITIRQKGFSKDEMFVDLSYVVYLFHWAATLLH